MCPLGLGRELGKQQSAGLVAVRIENLGKFGLQPHTMPRSGFAPQDDLLPAPFHVAEVQVGRFECVRARIVERAQERSVTQPVDIAAIGSGEQTLDFVDRENLDGCFHDDTLSLGRRGGRTVEFSMHPSPSRGHSVSPRAR